MQINLPVEIAPPSSAAEAPLPAAPKGGDAPSDFEQCLSSGEPVPTPKPAEAKSSTETPSAEGEEPAPVASAPVEEEPATVDVADAMIAATLAALTITFPTPPVSTAPAPTGEFGNSPVAVPPPAANTTPVSVISTAKPTEALTTPAAPVAAKPTAPVPSVEPKPAPVTTADKCAPATPLPVTDAVVIAEGAAEVAPPTVASASPEEKEEAPVTAATEETSTEEKPIAIAAETPIIATNSVRTVRRGTADAQDRSVMSDTLLTRQAKAKAAGVVSHEKAALSATVLQATPAVSTLAVANVVTTASAAKSRTAEPHPTLSAETLTPAAPIAPGIDSSISLNQPASTVAETPATQKAEAVVHDATVALDHVQRLTEQLHTTGRQQVDLEVRLHDDQRLTISLQMERGELKTTFKTDSTQLREALAQNWGQVVEKSDRSIRLNPPVFQSSQSQNGFTGDPRQQGREQRAFAETETEGRRFTFAPAAPTPAPPSRPVAAATTSSAFELYA